MTFSPASFNGVTIEWGGASDPGVIYVKAGDEITDGETAVTVSFSLRGVPQPTAAFSFTLATIGWRASERADTAATPGGFLIAGLLPEGVEITQAQAVTPAGQSYIWFPLRPDYRGKDIPNTVINDDGIVTANPAAVTEALGAESETAKKIASGEAVPLPVFTAMLDGYESTGLVTVKTTLNALVPHKMGEVIMLKLRRNDTVAELARASAIESVNHGAFVMTDESGAPIPAERAIEKDVYYYVTVGIGDNRDNYDWDMTPGKILDPIIASVNGTNDPSDPGGGGCDAGASAGLALAALAFAAFSKRGRG
jgi:hypothetical protein